MFRTHAIAGLTSRISGAARRWSGALALSAMAGLFAPSAALALCQTSVDFAGANVGATRILDVSTCANGVLGGFYAANGFNTSLAFPLESSAGNSAGNPLTTTPKSFVLPAGGPTLLVTPVSTDGFNSFSSYIVRLTAPGATSGTKSLSLFYAAATCPALTGACGAGTYGVTDSIFTLSVANSLINEFAGGLSGSIFHIASGPDGNLWFTRSGANTRISKITTAGVVTEFALPAGCVNCGPFGIAAGPDGNLWFTETAGNKIGKITIAGAVTEYALPNASSSVQQIAAGPDGALWFTESAGNRIGRITTAGAISEFMVPTAASGPQGIAAGADGALWFTEKTANKIGRLSTSGIFTEFVVPTPASQPGYISAGSDGALWFTQTATNKIGRITTGGVITEFGLPAGSVQPNMITAGPDGALWYAKPFSGTIPSPTGDKIGRITTGGVVTEFSLAAGSDPQGLVAGPDGGIWFTEANGGANKIGRLTIPTTPATWSLAAIADFDAAGPPLKNELLWRNSAGDLWQWIMTNSPGPGITIASSAPVTFNAAPVALPLNWRLLAKGKFDADTKADLLWRDSNNNQLWLWLMNGAAITSGVRVTLNNAPVDMPANWTLMATGDFDANGSLDLLWRDSATNQLWLWSMSGAAIVSSVRVTLNNTPVDMPANWVLMTAADFDANGKTDLLWRDASTNQLWLWSMNGAAIASSVRVTVNTAPVDMSANWTLMTAGNFTSPTTTDLLWRDATNGQLWLWTMNAAAIASSVRVTLNSVAVDMPANWALLGSGDLDGDSKTDLVWRDTTTGDTYTWKMNGAAIAAAGGIGLVP